MTQEIGPPTSRARGGDCLMSHTPCVGPLLVNPYIVYMPARGNHDLPTIHRDGATSNEPSLLNSNPGWVKPQRLPRSSSAARSPVRRSHSSAVSRPTSAHTPTPSQWPSG